NFSVTDPEGSAVSADVYLSNAGGGTNYTGREATKRSKAAYAGGSASIVYSAAEAAQYLVAGQTYTARLTGFDNLGTESGYQYSQSFVYQGSSLPAPNLISPGNGVISVSPTNAQFYWGAVTGANEYRIVISTDPNFGNFNTDLANLRCLDANCRTASGGNLLNATFNDLNPSTTYYWHVRNERSPWSGTRSFTTQALSSPIQISPANMTTNVSPTNAQFSWNAVTGATQYRIVLSTTSDFAYFDETSLTCTDTVKCKTLNSGNSTNASFTDLKPATTYFWHVRASATGITSLWSAIWQLTTSSGDAITVSAVTPLQARLDVAQNFEVKGTGLTSGMGFTIEDCEPETGGAIPEVGTGTSIQRTFRCVPRLPGPKQVTVKTAPGGTVIPFNATVTVDHPARLGNPAARGIPSSGGVSLWNGNFYHSVVDMAVPGKGVSFVLSRSYNSYHFDYEQLRGGVDNYKPWRFNWELSVAYVQNTGSKRLYVQREDGSGENFFKDTDNLWYAIDQGNFDKLQGDNPAVGQTTLFTRAGLRYIFQNPDLGGKLLFIRDHEGNKLTLNYGTNGKVGSILDSSGRSYTFSYDPSSNRLLQVTDFAGRYVAYTWDVDTANG
ncbi:MAG: fibronectin type III domain-containing protein, partial [Candidatus Methylumidiphilus sp.]